MKFKRILLTVFSLIILVLEALPDGVVLLFANPEGEPWRNTFSYFSLTPFGYANFGPFITALLSCVIATLIIILLFKNYSVIKKALRFVSAAAVVTSLMPLMYGTDYLTPISIFVSVLLSFIFLLSLIKEK